MKKVALILSLFCGTSLFAQQASDVVMTVNNKPVTLAEFSYSYNKNNGTEGAVEQISAQEYAQMYVNYKLKVAEAEALGYDTLTSFVAEFRQYRDMQLTPLLVDTVFIENRAQDYYSGMQKQLGGKHLLRCSHILLRLEQNASQAVCDEAAKRADSLHVALQNGADFHELAKQFSGDPGSAKNGGRLPWIGPGSTLKEFEDAAYALEAGQISKPVLSPVGYHIIFMEERKELDPYVVLRPMIIQMLKSQGIEEASAEANMNARIKASNGKLTREDVMQQLLKEAVEKNPEVQYLVNEYYDGLLLYEVAKEKVWDAAAKDTVNLEAHFKQNKAAYKWDEPRYEGFVIQANDKAIVKKVKKILKKHAKADWRKVLRQEVNKDSVVCSVQGPYLCKAGENRYVDYYVFKKGDAKPQSKYAIVEAYGKKKKQPKTYLDVKAQVVADYTRVMEEKWVEGLRKKFTFTINESVLSTMK